MCSLPARRIAMLPLALALALAAAAALAGPAPVAAPEADTLGASQTDEMIDAARDSARETALWLARGVDSWFGDLPFSDGGAVSDGRLSVSVLQRQHESTHLDVRFNARFRLPNLDRLSYVFLGRDERNEVVTDKPGQLSSQDQLLKPPTEDTGFFAGLGRPLSDAVDLRLGIRGRLRVYAQARYRGSWQLGAADRADFRQTLFWTAVDGLGTTSALSYEHGFSPTLALRWLSSATGTQNEPRIAWSTLVGSYRSFGDQKLLSLEALANGQQGSGVGANDAGLQLRWEQPMNRPWLLVGVVVGHFWPRPDLQTPRTTAWALGVNAKMRF